MRPLWRLCFRELRNHWRFSLFFILNLASGLVGLVLISTLLQSVQTSLDGRSQSLLGADLSVSLRRSLNKEELEALEKSLPAGSEKAIAVDFFTMLEEGDESRLVQVRAVDPGYPFYGDVWLSSSTDEKPAAFAPLQEKRIAWVEKDTAEDFSLTPGKAIQLGGAKFSYSDSIREDSTQGILTLAAAPRVLVARKWLTDKYLESRGTTLRYSWLIRLPQNIDPEQVKKKIESAIQEPSVRVQTHRDSSEGVARLLKYFSDYLALVSLASLSLAALGVVYQFRRFFLSRTRSIAILLSLGATPRQSLMLVGLQLSVLATAASALSIVLAAIALPIFAEALAPFSVVPFAVELNARVVAQSLATGIGLSFLLCLPQIQSLRKFSASELFREQTKFYGSQSSAWWYLPALVAYAGLCVAYSNSFRIAAYFVGGLLLSAALFSLMPWLILKVLSARSRFWKIEPRLALHHLQRNPVSTLLVAVCLGLVTLLGALLPQIRASVHQEIFAPEQGDRPSFFLLDIQPDQLAPLKSFLESKGANLEQPSALIRGRLTGVNGQGVSRREFSTSFVTREEEQEAAFRNRGFNLSYRDGLSSSETLLSGVPFSGSWDPKSGKVPEVSVEAKFGQRLGWKLGDVLDFDIAGETVQGKVTNIRSVRWASFQPNFFVIFQPGVLEDFSGVFIGIVPRVEATKARELARDLPKNFANISIIPVDKVLDRLYGLSEQMVAALLLTTLWVVIAAALTLYSIARYESYNRLSDMNLLKVLGATQDAVKRVFLWETLLLTSVCAVMGAGAGVFLSYALMRWGMEGAWRFDYLSVGGAAVVTILWMYFQTLFAAARIWKSRPRELLAG